MAIDLAKKVKLVNVTLEKKNVFGQKAQIVFAEDISGSMSGRFRRGVVQELTNRLLAIGMAMDDNKEIDVYAFNHNSHYVGTANERNIDGYVNDVFLRQVRVGGSTNYSKVMNDIVKKFGGQQSGLSKLFSKKGAPIVPTLVFFITDGEVDYDDKYNAEQIIKASSDKPIFWQFVGIGGESDFRFLKGLDDMGGRVLDNADFFEVEDPNVVSDEWFYEQILNEFPDWIVEARAKGILL